MGNSQSRDEPYGFDRGDLFGLQEAFWKTMDDCEHDDGSFAPLFICLACSPLIESGFEIEQVQALALSETFISLRKKASWLSWQDFVFVAAHSALSMSKGPWLGFVKKKDLKYKPKRNVELITGDFGLTEKFITEGSCSPESEVLDSEGRIRGWEELASHIRQVFHKMGITSDAEIVALIAGGHSYGRCHRNISGYAGSHVLTPTEFSKDLAMSLLQNSWRYVENGTKVDGFSIPEETRPATGKRQYMSGWEPKGYLISFDKVLEQFTIGCYKVVSGKMAVRRTQAADGYIIEFLTRDQEFTVWFIKQVEERIVGQLDSGGWVLLFSPERGGDHIARVSDLHLIPGSYIFQRNIAEKSSIKGFITVNPSEEPFFYDVSKHHKISVVDFFINEATQEIYGKVEGEVYWVKLVLKDSGGIFERQVKNRSDSSLRENKCQMEVNYTMMLPSDMVLLWDDKFRVHLERFAKSDEEDLRTEFGAAYRKLIQAGFVGCPGLAHLSVKE